MWYLIQSEFRYNWPIFIGYIFLTALFSYFMIFHEFLKIYFFVLTGLAVYYWNIFSLLKENRLLQYINLPLKYSHLAFLRIIIPVITVILGGTITLSIHLFIYFIIGTNLIINSIQIYLNLLLYTPIIYYLYLILRDYFISFIRTRLKIDRTKSKLIIIIMILFVNIFGFLVLFTNPNWINIIIRKIILNWPFTGSLSYSILAVLNLFTALITIFTFNKKPNYLEL